MRCENCQTDVAAQVAEDGSIICGHCGGAISDAEHPQLNEQLRQAKELLERWSKEPLLEPLEPLPGRQASHLSEVEKFQAESESGPEEVSSSAEPETKPEEVGPLSEDSPELHFEEDSRDTDQNAPATSSEIELSNLDPLPPEPTQKAPPRPEQIPEKSKPQKSKPKFRFDAAHVPEKLNSGLSEKPAEQDVVSESESTEPSQLNLETHDTTTVANKEIAASPVEAQVPAEPVPAPKTTFQTRRIDAAQPVAVHSPPHIDIQQLIDQRLQEEKQGFNWMVFAGQWLSYLGVLGLTAGAALIVYGYFGGTTDMVPKGWMLTTAGQMLLLLGIVTLISGGLESANSEVNTRIQVLGEQMLRFERDTKEQLLRGPKIPASQYAEGAKPAETTKTADKTVES